MSLLFTKAGDVLVYLAVHPGSTPKDMQEGMRVRPQKLYAILCNLRALKLLRTQRGRRNGRKPGYAPRRYYVELDVPFVHPGFPETTTLRKAFASVALELEAR